MHLQTFGERLMWARRHYAKLTQQQLRDRMQEQYGEDIGRNYISQLETDSGTKPTFTVARAAAGVLNISLDWLAGFTEQYGRRTDDEETPPHYFSSEADEVAQLVDAMHPSQREILLTVAKNMTTAPSQRFLNRAELRDMLDSVERDHGDLVRRKVEQTMRAKGLPVDPAA